MPLPLRTRLAAVLVVTGCLAGSARAQHGPPGAAPAPPIDTRHGLNHAYAPRGAIVQAPPREAIVVPRGGDRYWFHGGTWYHPDHGRYVVVGAPLGVVVPVLPPLYVTLMVAGTPYYYANDTYYSYNADAAGYEVVAPPADIDGATVLPPTQATPASSQTQYVYPRNGQSAEQQATDRYECHRWAADQTGFDPTVTSGGVAPELADASRAQYLRAMNACLEGRGYTVR